MSASSATDTRRHPRYELLASVELHQGQDTLILPARNLSLGGIYLGADGHDLGKLAIGSVVEVLVFDGVNEHHPAVRAEAIVVRHDKEGLGLKWKEGGETERAVARLLDAIRPSASSSSRPG